MISVLEPQTRGPYTVLAVTGEIDVDSAPALRDTALALLNRGADHLVIDLRGVTFMDSTGLGSLLRMHHRAGLLGASLHFVADQPAVLHLLDAMQLRRHLHVASTVAGISQCCPLAAPAPVPAGL